MGDDDAAGGLVPVAFVVEAGIGADGADNVVCRGCDVSGVLEDQAEAVAELVGTLLEEAEGVSVAVDAAAMAEVEFFSDFGGADPAEEVVFDGFAVGMLADDAADAVVVEAGGAFGSSELSRSGRGGLRFGV